MHHRWHYPNLTLLLISLVAAWFLLKMGHLEVLVAASASLGYFGVFFAGVLFVSTFTVVPAGVALFELASNLNPWAVGLIGGLGAMVGDYLAFIFIRDRLLAEISPILKMLHLYRRVNLLHSRHFFWLAPVVGALIVASPFPDEIGLTLMGLKKIKPAVLLAVTFLLNGVGILLIAFGSGFY